MTAGPVPALGVFGHGGGEPWTHALATGCPLRLVEVEGEVEGPTPCEVGHPVDVPRFLARADHVERRLLAGTRGSVLDVGCGPGRMVEEAVRSGRRALGVDVSPAAVASVTGRGLPAHQGSVYEWVPGEGTWDVVLLLDGNIGIGGDPQALVARCVELATRHGCLVVEVARDRSRFRRYSARVASPAVGLSQPFPWAEVGADAMADVARPAGWGPVREVVRRDRAFVVLAALS